MIKLIRVRVLIGCFESGMEVGRNKSEMILGEVTGYWCLDYYSDHLTDVEPHASKRSFAQI